MTGWPFPRVWVTHVPDGDTIGVEIDLGLDQYRKKLRVRFLNSNAPELGKPGAFEAHARLMTLCPTGTMVRVESAHWDRYANRIDGRIFLADGTDVEAVMLEEGLTTPR